jgi:3-phenylpropionate/trans-cinnamate dioxygenase ferredoxin subunit
VARVADIREDIIRTFEVDGAPVAVVKHDGRFYAFEGRCTHSGYPFDWSRIRPGDLVACSSHFSYFELATGKVLNGPATDDLQVYDVRIDGEDVLVCSEPRETLE